MLPQELEIAFRQVRRLARDRVGYMGLTSGQRGWRIGEIEASLEGAAAAAELEFGSFRKARLVLASDILEREIGSYNDLSDGELDALSYWATRHGKELKLWLRHMFGRQLSFLDSTSER